MGEIRKHAYVCSSLPTETQEGGARSWSPTRSAREQHGRNTGGSDTSLSISFCRVLICGTYYMFKKLSQINKDGKGGEAKTDSKLGEKSSAVFQMNNITPLWRARGSED